MQEHRNRSKMLVMKAVLFAITFMVLSGFVATAQTSPACDSVVSNITFENTSGLKPEQRASLEGLLMGRCFQREHPDVLTEAVYRQLLDWGFKQPTVYDPDHGHSIRVLDGKATPTPVMA